MVGQFGLFFFLVPNGLFDGIKIIFKSGFSGFKFSGHHVSFHLYGIASLFVCILILLLIEGEKLPSFR